MLILGPKARDKCISLLGEHTFNILVAKFLHPRAKASQLSRFKTFYPLTPQTGRNTDISPQMGVSLLLN